MSQNQKKSLMNILSRYQRPSLETQNQVPTETVQSQLPQSQDLVTSGSRDYVSMSPAQMYAYSEMEKRHITPVSIKQYLPVLNMIKPDIGKGVEGLFLVLENAELLHQALEETVTRLQEIINADHEFGLHSERDSVRAEEQSRWFGLSSPGVRGWEEGDWEKHASGNADGDVPVPILDKRESSENTDNRHEATLSSEHGAEWQPDDME